MPASGWRCFYKKNLYKRSLGICSGGLSMGLLPPMFMWHTSTQGGTQSVLSVVEWRPLLTFS